MVSTLRKDESKKTASAEAPPRIATQGRLMVVSKTLGTTFQYRFDTHNASSNGLLLASSDSGHIPFVQNTIVELTIDPDCRWGEHPVLCLGKVIRRETYEDTKSETPGMRMTRIGVQIVQIGTEEMVAWDSCRQRMMSA